MGWHGCPRARNIKARVELGRGQRERQRGRVRSWLSEPAPGEAIWGRLGAGMMYTKDTVEPWMEGLVFLGTPFSMGGGSTWPSQEGAEGHACR